MSSVSLSTAPTKFALIGRLCDIIEAGFCIEFSTRRDVVALIERLEQGKMMATKKKKKYTLSEKVFYGLGILIVVSMILGSILAATAPSF